MTAEQQRYCPLCDKLLISGEAVLQCSKCQRMHHPACWVKNEGCSLVCADAIPVPVAYTPPSPQYQPAHPGEGTRTAANPPPARGLESPRDPVEKVEPVARPSAGPPRDPGPAPRPAVPAGGEPVIGQSRPNAGAAKEPPAPVVIEPPPRANRGRYSGTEGRAPSVEDMKLYRNGGILRFWYIPVAGLLAIAVAVGVIFAADALFVGDDDTAASPGDDQATPTPDLTQEATPANSTPTPDTAETPAAQTPGAGDDPTPAAPTPSEPGELAVGMSVTIVDTGECLNIRREAGTESEIVACLADGVSMTITGGPQEANELTWWEVASEGATGWGAADYLAPAAAQ
jgi:hypothetical protein